MSLIVGITAMAITIIEMIGTTPAAIVEMASDERSAITKAMIAATNVMMQKIFTAGSWMSAPSGSLIIFGVTISPAIPISAIKTMDSALHQRARRPRSQAMYSAISSASGGIMAIM